MKGTQNPALLAYNYFNQLRESSSPLLTTTYSQLPDDASLSKHYDRLLVYRHRLCGAEGRFETLEKVETLFFKLANLWPGYGKGEHEFLKQQREKECQDFESFIEDLTTVFKRNGGHLCVLDLEIQAYQVFNSINSTK
ncbi:hypothetical protein DAMA08_025860 [Martiniozyma asiatica (nom. inval.)]|nr:hypothetical protein DAMA08_025860 [Martiniozyma asiatica]